MLSSVIGLPLDMAREILEKEGVAVESIELIRPPRGMHRQPKQSESDRTYVASAWETGPKTARLRVVSTPTISNDPEK